ncbi:MAG: nicotinate-nucleotide adenylyltransferase [Pirellula sp.]
MGQRIGIFGGSFDPVHVGHLIIAEQFREGMRLDQVRFIPTKVSPFKQEQLPTTDKQRLEMLRLAIGAHPGFAIDESEIRRGGVSYSIETIRELQTQISEAEWFLLIGADSLTDFAKWKEPSELLDRVHLVVVRRGGHGEIAWDALKGLTTPANIARIRSTAIDVPAMEIASRDIRQRVQHGRSIRYLVPASVEAYIREHKLWQSPESVQPATLT